MFACRHERTPWAAKALGAFVVASALSPIDLIPDFIPILGYVDDAVLLPVLIWLAIRMLPSDVVKECRAQAAAWMSRENGKPRSLWGAVFIVAIWIGTAAALRQWLRQCEKANSDRDLSLFLRVFTRIPADPQQGMQAFPSTSAQFGSFIQSEVARWAPLIKASGATID